MADLLKLCFCSLSEKLFLKEYFVSSSGHTSSRNITRGHVYFKMMKIRWSEQMIAWGRSCTRRHRVNDQITLRSCQCEESLWFWRSESKKRSSRILLVYCPGGLTVYMILVKPNMCFMIPLLLTVGNSLFSRQNKSRFCIFSLRLYSDSVKWCSKRRGTVAQSTWRSNHRGPREESRFQMMGTASTLQNLPRMDINLW